MTKVNHKLSAEIRTITGKKVKQLRKKGILPATVYGKDYAPVSLQINELEADKIYAEVGESSLVDLELDGKKVPILMRNAQFHAMTGKLLHLDFYKVNLKEKITTTVPLEFVGESLAVKNGNVLMEVISEVEIEALPADLPEKIEVDISVLETLESVITVADLKIDKAVMEIKNDPEQVIAKVEEPKEEIIEEIVPAAPEEVLATEQKTPEEKAAAEEEEKKAKEEEKKD